MVFDRLVDILLGYALADEVELIDKCEPDIHPSDVSPQNGNDDSCPLEINQDPIFEWI